MVLIFTWQTTHTIDEMLLHNTFRVPTVLPKPNSQTFPLNHTTYLIYATTYFITESIR